MWNTPSAAESSGGSSSRSTGRYQPIPADDLLTASLPDAQVSGEDQSISGYIRVYQSISERIPPLHGVSRTPPQPDTWTSWS